MYCNNGGSIVSVLYIMVERMTVYTVLQITAHFALLDTTSVVVNKHILYLQ